MTGVPKISTRERKMRQSLAFDRNLIVLALLILVPGAWDAAKGALTLRWPRAEATIVDANLRMQSNPSARARYPDEWASFHVHYIYSVGDRDYYAGGVEPYDLGMQNSAGARRMRERHPVGSRAQVTFDPENPVVSYLEPGPSSISLMMIGIGVIIGGSGLWIRHLARRGIGQIAT